MENFTEELRTARKNAVLTQKATAELLGVPLRTYEAWETGKRCPTEFTQKSIIKKIKEYSKMKNLTKEQIENELIEFAANNPHPILEELLFESKNPTAIDAELREFEHEYNAAPCDPEGATAEQDAEFDRIIEEHAERILNLI